MGLSSAAIAFFATALLGLPIGPSAVAAEPAPALSIDSLATPTHFVPGDSEHEYSYEVRVTNIGAASTDGTPITITDTLPAGLSVLRTELRLPYGEAAIDFGAFICQKDESAPAAVVTCTVPEQVAESTDFAVLAPGEEWLLSIVVSPAALDEGEPLANGAEVEGGGAPPASVASHNLATAAPPPPGFAELSATLTGRDGRPAEGAGSHPYQYTTTFALNTRQAMVGADTKILPAGGDLKDLHIALPPGLLADPGAALRCSAQQFISADCPDGSAVGLIVLRQLEARGTTAPVPIYNLLPDPGRPAQFGFRVGDLPFYIDTALRAGDHGLTASLRNLSQTTRVSAVRVTLWGTPADPAHDPLRGGCLSTGEGLRFSLGSCAAGIAPLPSFGLPTGCAQPLSVSTSFDTWLQPSLLHSETSPSPPAVQCNAVEFSPSLLLRPTTALSDSPSGLSVHMHVPQNEDPEARRSADLRRAVVALPPGLVLSPSGANGLLGCDPAQIGLQSAAGATPIRFDSAPEACPGGARIGTVEVRTPLLEEPLAGYVYLASPYDNPFDALLALYVVVEDPAAGILIKLAGLVEADPQTGQLTAEFPESPQVPFEDFRLDFFAGPLAPLRTPSTCGAYRVDSSLTPYSAPESGPPAALQDGFAINSTPLGAPCAGQEAGLPLDPGFQAGTLLPRAGAYSSFALDLRRADGMRPMHRLSASLPAGLLADLSAVSACSEAELGAAVRSSGWAESASPSCPAASRIGHVSIDLGPGPQPYRLAGLVYLAGPYRGAPFSLAIVVPDLAGPFDLGTSVVRVAVRVDPASARLRIETDPLPAILAGIPLDLRALTIILDRPDFILNPTSCDVVSTDGSLESSQGAAATLADRFQVGGCAELGFKPGFDLRLDGATARNGHPRVTATLRPRAGDANLGALALTIPRGELIDPTRLTKVCSKAEFAARACPPGSRHGTASATSPILRRPLRGPIHLRESDHRYPDLVVELRGEVGVDLIGRIRARRGAVRVEFDALPDVPLSRLRLLLTGGRRGLLANSEGLCRTARRTTLALAAQDGKRRRSRPLVRVACTAAASAPSRPGSRR